MNTTLSTRLASFASAAVLTVVMLVSVNTLAVSDAPGGLLAKATASARA